MGPRAVVEVQELAVDRGDVDSAHPRAETPLKLVALSCVMAASLLWSVQLLPSQRSRVWPYPTA